MDAVKVGKSIAFLRKKLNMTQKELSLKLNVTDKAVSRWERGCGCPDTTLLTKLSAALDTDIEALLEGNFTHDETDCEGLLVMNYPCGISSETLIHDKPVIDFQLSIFLLAGIRKICICGKSDDADFVRSRFSDGKKLGVSFSYETLSENCKILPEKTGFFAEEIKHHSLFVTDGLDFLYGKDITSTLKRIFFDSDSPVTVATYNKKALSMHFFPSSYNRSKKNDLFLLYRGVIAFPVKNENDLADAGEIIKIIEKQQHEKIADLEEIARNRGFV